jgi:hypothetical protein
MSERDGHFENVLLVLVVGGLVLAAVIYGLFWFWPYFVFYVLPVVAGTIIIGGILRYSVLPSEPGRMFSYIKLAISFPLMAFLISVIFFANVKRAYVMDKKGNVTASVVEWPELNKKFNTYRAETYAGSPFDALKKRAKETSVFDRQELGWLMYLCLFLTGPLFFAYLSRSDDDVIRAVFDEVAAERTAALRKRVGDKETNLNQIIAERLKDIREHVKEVEAEREKALAENQLLKAKVEFSSKVPRPPEAQKSGGLLDKDIL